MKMSDDSWGAYGGYETTICSYDGGGHVSHKEIWVAPKDAPAWQQKRPKNRKPSRKGKKAKAVARRRRNRKNNR